MAVAIGLVVVAGIIIFWGADIGRGLGIIDEKARSAEVVPAPSLPGAT